MSQVKLKAIQSTTLRLKLQVERVSDRRWQVEACQRASARASERCAGGDSPSDSDTGSPSLSQRLRIVGGPAEPQALALTLSGSLSAAAPASLRPRPPGPRPRAQLPLSLRLQTQARTARRRAKSPVPLEVHTAQAPNRASGIRVLSGAWMLAPKPRAAGHGHCVTGTAKEVTGPTVSANADSTASG